MKNREEHIGDQVILHVTQEELEEELANMEQLLKVLLRNIEKRFMSSEQKKTDIEELRNTFDVAMTAMKMVWLQLEGVDVKIEI